MPVKEICYEVKGVKTLAEMSWVEVEEALKRTDIVIVPVSSTEAHGPHLPLASDAIHGTDIGRRTVRMLAEEGIEVVAGPTIPFGVTPGLLSFPGTICLCNRTAIELIKDVCRSLDHHGFKKIVLMLAHGGNYATIQVAAEELKDEIEAEVYFATSLQVMTQAQGQILHSDRPTEEGHAGEGETSRILAITPELVQMDKAEVFYAEKREKKKVTGDGKPVMGGGWEVPVRDIRKVWPRGFRGNPKFATKKVGEKLLDLRARWLADLIKRDLAGR
jgi:creatinine amidohydrolase